MNINIYSTCHHSLGNGGAMVQRRRKDVQPVTPFSSRHTPPVHFALPRPRWWVPTTSSAQNAGERVCDGWFGLKVTQRWHDVCRVERLLPTEEISTRSQASRLPFRAGAVCICHTAADERSKKKKNCRNEANSRAAVPHPR